MKPRITAFALDVLDILAATFLGMMAVSLFIILEQEWYWGFESQHWLAAGVLFALLYAVAFLATKDNREKGQ